MDPNMFKNMDPQLLRAMMSQMAQHLPGQSSQASNTNASQSQAMNHSAGPSRHAPSGAAATTAATIDDDFLEIDQPTSAQPSGPPDDTNDDAEPAPEENQRAKKGKKRKAPADEEDEATAAIIARANEIKNRLWRESRWEHLLKGEQKEARVPVVLRAILGNNVSEDSNEWEETRAELLRHHRRYQNETLDHAENFIDEWVAENEGTNNQAWIMRLDTTVSDKALRELAEKAYSFQRFFKIYKYMQKYMDLETSGKQAQYFCKQIWKTMVVETVKSLRLQKAAGADDKKSVRAAARAPVIKIYTALPSSPNFSLVKRSGFTEVSPGRRAAAPRSNKRTENALAGVVLDAPPSDDEE